MPFAVGGQIASRPTIWLTIIGPRATDQVQVILDTGGECCLFAEWVAWRIGLKRLPSSPTHTMGSSITRTGFLTWFAPVEIQIDDPAGVIPPYRWPAIVGFTPAGCFTVGRAAGILGINGGLDQVQRVEFDWQALGGPEVLIRT
jgi:hypothetical protein